MKTPFAADCHFHIIDHARFPFPGNLGYTPHRGESGTFMEISDSFRMQGITHGVAVQPSGYGFDNAAMLDALVRSSGHFRGVAMVSSDTSRADLRRLADAGVVGLRFNLTDFDPSGLSDGVVRKLLSTLRDLDWFVEVQCRAVDFSQLASVLFKTGLRLLIDHLGLPDPALGINEPGFRAVLRMADTGRATVKLSGAFRCSREPYPFRDLDSFAAALLAAYTPENCIWGSDWPFINLPEKPDFQKAFSCLERWVPDDQGRRKILWDTPTRLFRWRVSMTSSGVSSFSGAGSTRQEEME